MVLPSKAIFILPTFFSDVDPENVLRYALDNESIRTLNNIPRVKIQIYDTIRQANAQICIKIGSKSIRAQKARKTIIYEPT